MSSREGETSFLSGVLHGGAVGERGWDLGVAGDDGWWSREGSAGTPASRADTAGTAIAANRDTTIKSITFSCDQVLFFFFSLRIFILCFIYRLEIENVAKKGKIF